MTELKKEQPKKLNATLEKKLYAEAKGQYTLVDGAKAFTFLFPANCSLEDNLAAISFMRGEIYKAVEAGIQAENKKREEEAKKVEPKVEEVVAEEVK